MRNSFYIWTRSHPAPEAFDPEQLRQSVEPSDVRYFCGILCEVDRLIPEAGQKFLLTWHLDKFDEKLAGAVVLLIGDEMYQVPSYATSVRAVFKTGGIRKNPLSATLRLPWSIAWRVVLRDLRNRAVTVRRRLRHARTGAQAAPLFELPLGYHRLVEVPYKPVAERGIDAFFAGSISSGSKFSVRPGPAGRRHMTAALQEACLALPNFRIEYTPPTQQLAFDPETYSGMLMNARIALCPRGNFDETFRLFEAARSGCVVIAEPLPDRWYYADAPVIQIPRWSALTATLRELLGDNGRVQAMSERTQRWWHDSLSEPAIARYICDSLSTNGEARRPAAAVDAIRRSGFRS